VSLDNFEHAGSQFPVGGVATVASGIWELVGQAGLRSQQVVSPLEPPRGSSQRAARLAVDGGAATLLMGTFSVTVPPGAGGLSASGGASGSANGTGGVIGGRGGGGNGGGGSDSARSEVDFSGRSGFSFWARTTGADTTFIFSVSDTAATPDYSFFLTEGTPASWPSIKLAASAEWRQYTVLFTDLHRTHPLAANKPLDLARVTGVHFVTGYGVPPVDFWIDDISVLCRGACWPGTKP
jgi:hypothetical protein